MQWLGELGGIILSTYLAFTGAVATYILEFTNTATEESTLSSLPSQYENEIPKILLEQNAFQSANVLGSLAEHYSPSSIEEATVNIFCSLKTKTGVRTATGSGFFVSPSGAILTNAHVAQFLLLEHSKEYENGLCVVRTGSLALPSYYAKLLYVPPAWVQENANLIDVKSPVGTGERDYALLFAYASVGNAPLPVAFPYLALETESLTKEDVGQTLTAAGYPATPLYKDGPAAALPQVAAQSTISDVFTFSGDTADVVSMAQTPVSATGASGGPMVNDAGKAIAVIATKSDDPLDSLRGLTISYINRTIEEETGLSLRDYLRGDLAVRAAVFNEALAPFLTQLLEFELE